MKLGEMKYRLDWGLLDLVPISIAFCTLVLLLPSSASAHEPPLLASPTTAGPVEANPAPDILPSLVEEALTRSPLITAARRHWEAEARMPIQESTLPEPQITFQNLAVGNPIPGHELQTNNFAYFGYGASQDIPFPTKLHLKASVAEKESTSAREAYEAQQRAAVEQVRETYFNLVYLTESLGLLRRTYGEFQQVGHITEAQYQVGMTQQQDVLKAQLQTTEILNEEETTREELGQGQADLKAILGREPDSPSIRVSGVRPSELDLSDQQLRKLALTASPVLRQAEATEARSEQSLKLARADYFPDFSLEYMYQKTGSRFPDYYVATLGLKIPLYFWRKQTPAVEQAALEKESSHAQTYAARLSVIAQAQDQLIATRTAERVIKIYSDGLIPQAKATLKSALATYRVGKVDFQTLLSAEVDVLRLEQQYYRAVADHEIAVAKIRQIVGDVQ